MRPVLGVSRPAIVRRSVLLPPPLGPKKRGDAVEAQLFRDIEVESGKGKLDPEGQQLSRHARGNLRLNV